MRDIGGRGICMFAKIVGGINLACCERNHLFFGAVQASCVFVVQIQESYEKNLPTFHYTSCFMVIGILIMAYYNSPYKWVVQSPLYS